MSTAHDHQQAADTGYLSTMTGRGRAMLADRLVRNVGWYGLAEFGNRFTRLATTMVLARWLMPEDFGIAAVAMTTFEIIRVISHTGIGQAVVRASEEELPALCATAYRACWMMAGLAFGLQLLVGAAIAYVTGRLDVFYMIACLAAVYLTQPFGQIQCHLIARANRLHVVAGVGLAQVGLDNILTAMLAISGFGPWAVVLPKLLTSPVWVIGMRRAQSWHRDTSAGYAPMLPLMRYAATVIGSELLVAARLNLDNVLVGAILGIQALGIYYFVFSAGLGFSLSLTGSIASAVYPHLAEMAGKPRELIARYDGLMLRAVLPVAAVIALQAALALLYVPIVFGAKWTDVAYLVAILCASAITKPVYDNAAQLLRAIGRPRTEFCGSATLTVASLTALAIALPFGLAAGIIALSATTFLFQLALAIAVRFLVFRPDGAIAGYTQQPSGAIT